MPPFNFYMPLFAVGTTLGLLLVLRLVRKGLADDLARGSDAARFLALGEVLAAFFIAAEAVRSTFEAGAEATGLLHHAVRSLVVGSVALVLALGAARIGIRLLLGGRLQAEVVRGNVAAGIAGGAQYVAAAIVTGHAVGGESPTELLLALAFLVLGQAALLLCVSAFRALTTYDDAEQILGENRAAATSYAGIAVAVALVIGRAIDGEFSGWLSSIRGFLEVLLFLLFFYPVRQLLVQSVLLHAPFRFRGGAIDAAILQDRSVGLAMLEASTYLGTAFAFVLLA